MDAAWSQPFVVWPDRGAPVSVATWLREVAGFAASRIAAAPFPEGAARGHGEPVIVVPAFFSLDHSTSYLRRFLGRQGFVAECWKCGRNLGPTRRGIESFDRRVCESAEHYGRKVSLVGVSLGGTLARETAKRRPDYVARVVTLVSPINTPVSTPLAPLARLAATLWDSAAQGAFEGIPEPPPVPLTAIVSPIDGVVDWRACLPRPAPQVETVLVAAAHMTIGSNPAALRVLAARLAGSARA